MGAKTVYEPYNVAATVLAPAKYDQAYALAGNSVNLKNSMKPVYPTKTGSAPTVPQAASVTNTAANTSDKARGGWNIGMTTALVTGALGMMADYTQSRYNAKALRAQANAYEAQIPLNYEAYRTNINYLSEENFANVSRIIDEYEALTGAQMASMGASGFDVSTGDQRIIKDTQQKMRNEVYLANRSTYLQSFEMWRSTMMEENRLLAAAASARSQAKYVKKMGKINLISGAVSTAAGVMAAAYGPRLATVGGTK